MRKTLAVLIFIMMLVAACAAPQTSAPASAPAESASTGGEASAGQEAAPAAAPSTGERVLRASFAWPTNIDPAMGSDFSSSVALANLYDSLVFPNLDAANAAYKLVARLGNAEAVGPILVGMARPIQIIPTGAEVRDIVNIAALAVVDAQKLDGSCDEDEDVWR